MNKAIIEEWGIDILELDHNKSISGEIYNSETFEDGKIIYTSRIDNLFIEHYYLSEPTINVKTINKSTYILGKISKTFNEYLEFIVDTNNLCKDTYNINSNIGIINIIKWYLDNNN